MRQLVGGVAVNLGSHEGVGFDMGVGKMVSVFKVLSHPQSTSQVRNFQEVWKERMRKATE